MIIDNKFYSVSLSDDNGTIVSYTDLKQNFIKKSGNHRALLEIKLLNGNGEGVYLNSNTANEFDVEHNGDIYTLNFINICDGLSARVFMRCPENEPFIYWSCEILNDTGLIIEWIGLPGIVTENELKGHGGDFELFWPFGEGCVVDNLKLREENDWLCYRELTYQSTGYNGTYPGSVSMQFMAYYNEYGGLYVATHDENGYMKAFEYHPYDGGVCIELRHFTDGAEKEYKMQYEIVTGVFEGNWQDAAQIYRSWIEATDMLPQKISDRNDLPKWYGESPVVALYPIRGKKDNGDMTPNLYYPYENVIPFIDEYSEKMNVKMMALPMHWAKAKP